MTVIPIYDAQGQLVNQLEINDTLTFVNGRVSKGQELYYKGVGAPYRGHFILDDFDPAEYDVLGMTDVFYLGTQVSKHAFQNKFGIFQVRYQPFFPDFIGACSIKERAITGNAQAFKLSSVEVVDVVNYDRHNQQYYFRMRYDCGRRSYLQGGSPAKLKNLLDYMLRSDWNFLWDKAAINDISWDGRVSDTADLFQSDELEHQLGTVYAVLYSLAKNDFKLYVEFLDYCKLRHVDDTSYVFNSIHLLNQQGIDIAPLLPSKNPAEIYKTAVLDYLTQGKNCAYCSCDMFVHAGNQVRDQYAALVRKQLDLT